MLVVGKEVMDLDPEGRRVQIFRQDWRAGEFASSVTAG
jgi:hypothetical protein